jgi:hypothetical protein
MNKLVLCGMVAMACMTAGVAVAEDYGYDESNASHDSAKGKKMMMGMGRHGMAGKVESVDHKTGWIKVKTEEGVMTVHFPPDSIKDLKDGDTITVHLSYTTGEKKGGEMMDHGGMDNKMMDGGMTK